MLLPELDKLHADKACDFPHGRQALRTRDITPRIVRRAIDSSERLGRYCWVVERPLSWLDRCRWLKVCYRRRDGIHAESLSTIGLGSGSPIPVPKRL